MIYLHYELRLLHELRVTVYCTCYELSVYMRAMSGN